MRTRSYIGYRDEDLLVGSKEVLLVSKVPLKAVSASLASPLIERP
jgi:hypothetical protein